MNDHANDIDVDDEIQDVPRLAAHQHIAAMFNSEPEEDSARFWFEVRAENERRVEAAGAYGSKWGRLEALPPTAVRRGGAK